MFLVRICKDIERIGEKKKNRTNLLYGGLEQSKRVRTVYLHKPVVYVGYVDMMIQLFVFPSSHIKSMLITLDLEVVSISDEWV